MSTVVEKRLGKAGYEWVSRSLVGTRLGDLVHARHSLDKDLVTAVVPDTVTEERAHRFEIGGLLDPGGGREEEIVREPGGTYTRLAPKPNTDEYIVGLIRAFLRESPSHVCVFEDQISRPGDRFATTIEQTLLVRDGVLFHVLDSSHDNPTTIAATVQAAKKGIHTMLGVLGSLPQTGERSSIDLPHLVATLAMIVVDAYDGESYVIWRPR